jgi:hypothetical protein
MRLRLVSLAATAAVAAAIFPAHAGTVKPLIVDPSGDANGINSQPGALGPGGPNPNLATGPASYASADIVGVSFVNNFTTKKVKHKTVKTPVSFTVTMTLAAAPDPSQTYYNVGAVTASCPDGVTFEFSAQPSVLAYDDVTCLDASANTFTDYPAQAAVVKGNTISWTVMDGGFPAGAVLTDLTAYAGEGFIGSTPTLDQAESSESFAIGK